MRQPTWNELLDEISRLGPGTVPPWLLVALDDAAAGRSRAVLHPLGFLCIPALRLAECGVCVHLWARWFEAGAPTTSQAHCHSWDLHSVVIAGGLRNHVLRVTPTPPVSHRIFAIHSTADEDRIEATPRLVSCRVAATGSYTSGGTYALPAGQFHLTEIPADHAATVVLARDRPDQVDLSLGPLDTASHRVRRRLCTPAQGARAAREVARMLGHEPGAGRSSRGTHGRDRPR